MMTVATKYSPIYRVTYITTGDIKNNGLNVITTVEATYHDVDPNN